METIKARFFRQIETVRAMLPSRSYREISASIGVPYWSLRRYIEMLQDSGDLPVKARRWVPGEDATLRLMVAAGASDAEIALAIGRTAQAVITRTRAIRHAARS